MSRARLALAGWAAVVLLAALVPYRDFLSGLVPVGRDLVHYFYPMKAHLAEAVSQGELPLVDRFRWGGAPLLGAPGAAAFYPGNLLFLVLPLGAAMKAWMLVHLALGVAGFAAFSRRIGLPTSWAWLAGLLYGLSGVSVSAMPFCSTASAIAWIPWLAAGALDLARWPSPRTAVGACVPAALLLLGAPPEMILHGAAISALLVLAPPGAGPRSGVRPRLRARLGWALAAGAAAAALAAPAVTVSLRAQAAGVREGGARNEEWAALGSFPEERLPELALDFVVADWSRVLRGPGVEGYPYFPSVTPGRVALALAIVGLVAGRRRAGIPAFVALSGVLLALGPATPVWRGAIRLLPPLAAVRYPEKNLVLWAFGAAWLAAVGLAFLAARLPARAATLALPGLLVAVLLDRGGTARGLMPMGEASVLTRPPTVLASILPTGGPSPASPPRLFHRDSLVPVPVFDVADLPGALATGRQTAAPAYASLFGIAYVFELDYDLTLPREAYEWLRLLSKAASAENPIPRRMVRNVGAAAVLASRPGADGRFHPFLEAVPDPVPPWRFVSRVATDPNGLRLFGRMLEEGAPPDVAYVLGEPGPAERDAAPGRVLEVADRPAGLQLIVEVDGPGDGVLFLSRLRAAAEDAAVDGRPVPVADAGFGFAAVRVPPGRHLVSARPRTGWVRSAIVLSALALGLCALALSRSRREAP